MIKSQIARSEAADGHRHSRGGKRYFGRGGVKFALLKLLENESMHGYQMMKILEEQSGGLYSPSAGSIYPTLQMLEARGFITFRLEESGKKIYSITEQGRSGLLMLPENTKRGKAEDCSSAPNAEAFRIEKVRLKLGLSSESYDLLRLVTRAEQEASACKERAEQLQLLLYEQQLQINEFLTGHELEHHVMQH
ncbi:PadR family transcriptional regulator [Paenibacillus paridis]|uniref:PadR family transcriptional regulator n=1 Tax=Paenibacillus paridis TaxID=2583376 RepID=UPI001120B896|nr:PadR family transcriptional regulator [Paenibacillus paridis]